MIKKRSNEFEEKKSIQEIQAKNDVARHKMTMKELSYRRESDKIRHDQELTRQRIKTAEIKRTQERKANRDFADGYHKVY